MMFKNSNASSVGCMLVLWLIVVTLCYTCDDIVDSARRQSVECKCDDN